MKRQKVLLVVLALLLVSLPAQAVIPTGELNLSLGYQKNSETKEIVHNSSRTGFRLVLEDNLDFDAKFHFSTKGWWDWKQKEGQLTADQLWISGYYGDFDYQVGKQAINWGTADGFNPTNYFSRMSSSSLVTGDLAGNPIWAAQALYYGPSWSLTGVIIPVFTPQKLDDQMTDLIMEEGPQSIVFLEAIEGTKKPRGFGKSELALRAETQLAGFDVQASYFWGYEPLPGLEMVINLENLMLSKPEGTYRRQHVLGLATSGTLGPAGVWGEVAYVLPEQFAKSESPTETELRIPMSINENYFQAVVGGDYTFDLGKGLLTQVQYIYRGQGSLLTPYVPPTEEMGAGEIEPAHYLYGRLAYDFSQDSSADLVVIHGVQEKGGLFRPSYTHRFPGSIQLELSLVKTYGKGDFASIPSQAQIGLKYLF